MNYLDKFENKIIKKKDAIDKWLSEQVDSSRLPLYSSVDVRDSGFKAAVVDTNLFPAGFNNLCDISLKLAVHEIKKAINERVSNCKNIIIITEEHTRNKWYLENVHILKQICLKAGFNTKAATFLGIEPPECDDIGFIKLETAKGHLLKIHCLTEIIQKLHNKEIKIDLIILNNDLISGIPDLFKEFNIPIYPSPESGWHTRKKYIHFQKTNELINKFFIDMNLDIDPWFLSTIFSKIEDIDINDFSDQNKLKDIASDLIGKITIKYKEHKINEKPFVFLKANAGTYGMGVKAIEDPNDIIKLNRKDRNSLSKGKGATVIDNFILQEGITSKQTFDKQTAEVVVYQIADQITGSFLRVNSDKTNRQNLNSKGMYFERLCDDSIKIKPNHLTTYHFLAKIAAIAAYEEFNVRHKEY